MTDSENEERMELDDEGYEPEESANDDYVVEPVTARERLREQLAHEVAAFLASGGQIQQVESHLLADPPSKPPYNYGSQL